MKMEKKLSNLSIGKKIILGFFVIISIFGVMELANYYQADKLSVLAEDVIPISSQISSLQEFAITLESFLKVM